MILRMNANQTEATELFTATELLKKHLNIFRPRIFNQVMIDDGFLEQKENFKALTDKGMAYGRNAPNLGCRPGTHPVYFEDKFEELLGKLFD